MINNSLQDVFSELETSLIRIEILVFFSKNPYAMDIGRKFAQWIRRPESSVITELDYLARKGIVDKMGEGENAIYSLVSDLDIVQAIDEFAKTLAKRRTT
ncbi:TPA: hypothetical protein DCX16_02200 [bacterium]|nr:hypothetical protein [bacterium]